MVSPPTASSVGRRSLWTCLQHQVERGLGGDEQLGACAQLLWAVDTPSADVALGAAAQASKRLAHEQAAEFYAMARRTLQDPDGRRSGELILLEGRSLTRTGASGPRFDAIPRDQVWAAQHASTALHLPVVEHMPTLAALAETVLANTGHDHRT